MKRRLVLPARVGRCDVAGDCKAELVTSFLERARAMPTRHLKQPSAPDLVYSARFIPLLDATNHPASTKIEGLLKVQFDYLGGEIHVEPLNVLAQLIILFMVTLET